jgi:hypothetical protein
MMKWKLSIPRLDDLTIPQRIVLTMAVVILILLVLFALGANEEAIPESGPSPVTKWEEHIVKLEKEALDEAFKKYIMQLYNIWVSDNYQPKIPPRAIVGARNARDAYVRTMEAIEEREKKIAQ